MKKFFLIFFLLPVLLTAQDLKITGMRIFCGEAVERTAAVTEFLPGTTQVKARYSRKLKRIKTRFLFIISNTGKRNYTLPTAGFNHSFYPLPENRDLTAKQSKSLPQNTFRLVLTIPSQFYESANAPRLPLIEPLTKFAPVELRPGEGVAIAYDMELESPEGTFIIEYQSDSRKGRYPFWTGRIISEPFAYAKNPDFTITTVSGEKTHAAEK